MERIEYDVKVQPSAETFSPFYHYNPKFRITEVQDPQEIKGILLRLKTVKILKAHEGVFSGSAEVYFVSQVTDGVSDKPIKVSETTPWTGVKPGSFLDILNPGVVLYSWDAADAQPLPKFLDWRFMLLESDKGTRDAGEVLNMIGTDSNFNSIQSALVGLIKAANPLSVILGLTDQAFQLVGAILKMNQDDLIAKAAVTYTRDFDHFGVPVGSTSFIVPSPEGLLKVGDAAIQFEILLRY